MSIELHKEVAGKRIRSSFLGVLSLAALLLALWQTPLIGLVHREAGTRALLAAVTDDQSSSTSYRRAVFIKANPEDLAVAKLQLEQADDKTNTFSAARNTYRTLGVAELASNNLIGAQSWLQRRLQTTPNDVITRFFLGETHFRLGDTQTAIEQWEEVGAQAQLMELARELVTRGEQVKALTALP